MKFSNIIGQAKVKEHLLASVRNKKVSHAQLFLGPEGNGALALALAFAQYINCENPSLTDSCGLCGSCKKSQKMIHPDIHYSYPYISKNGSATKSADFISEWRSAIATNPYMNVNDWLSNLEAENKQVNINVAGCREVIQNLSMKTFEAKYKVVILWLPEYLGKEGNILLKTLEEPPDNSIIILVAQSEENILPTILSRTQMLRVPRMNEEDIKEALIAGYGLHDEKAANIAWQSEGNYNLALYEMKNMADDNGELFREWISICAKNDFTALGKWVEEIAGKGRENQKIFIRYALTFLQECLRLNITGAENSKLAERELKMASWMNEQCGSEGQRKLMELWDRSYMEIERNANPKILFTYSSFQLSRLLHKQELGVSY